MAADTPRNADFIGRVVKDAKNPPETRLLTGWLGDAAEKGYRRLYTDAELSAYVDIPADAILYTEPIRDSQPAGGVFVWIQRDAVLKPGGSASSRAARFLQGQVQQDFASAGGGADPEPGSIEKAGYRCVTQVPCGEPTGFTGRCTKQPVVGGAWPCITVIPHCSEPTGFTGQCTHQPWPNPTQYVGCTIYHCPTRDLTHIQQICNIAATGMPGCPVVDPLGGGIDPAAKASAEAADEGGGSPAVRPTPPVPVTSIPGCGYTRTWGLCPTLPQKCQVSVNIPCITQTETPQCRGIDLAAAGQFGAASQICATSIGCNITLLCPNAAFRAAGPGAVIPGTQAPCSAVDTCPTRIGCVTKAPTVYCTQFGEPLCPPTPATTCTQIGAHCPTSCGAECQSQQVNCTQVGEICLTHPLECTQLGPKCPSLGIACTIPPGCTTTNVGVACQTPICPPAAQAFRAAGPGGQTAAVGCTQTGNNCLTIPDGDCTFFGGCQQTLATVCTQSGPQCPTHAQPHCTCAGPGCPPTPATVCTQSGPQCPSQFGSGCPTDTALDCTFGCTHFGPDCPTNLAQTCNQNLAARAQAAAGGGAQITPLTVPVWQCHAPTPATHCFICPPPHYSRLPWLCPAPSPWCPPSPFCPPITQTFFCGGGGPSAVDACPTRLCGPGGGLGGDPLALAGGGGGGQAPFAAAARAAQGLGGGQIGVSSFLRCTQVGCPPFFTLFENQCALPLRTIFECPTSFPICVPTNPLCPPTPIHGCPPPSNAFLACTSIDPSCRAAVGTIAGPQCQGFARAVPVKEPTPATVCFICTQVPWLCPVAQ